MREVLESYKGKKVIITGHSGFKGAWLSFLLHYAGAEVVGYALSPNTEPSLFKELDLENLIESHFSDVRDYQKLSRLLVDTNPDFIFHLAAQPLVRYSYANALETHETNILGTANVLEACKLLKSKCSVVCITTDKVYQNKEWQYPYRETDQLGGYDPYSASKAAAEIIIDSFRKSFFTDSNISISSARAGNVIGGGDWSKDRLIPDVVNSINENIPVVLRNPHAIRPWQHVLDPIYAYLLLGYKMDNTDQFYNSSWNIGPYAHDCRTVLQVCNELVTEFGSGEIQINQENSSLHEAGILKLDISKAMGLLEWFPRWDSTMAIQKTARWYKQFYSGKSARHLIQDDIQAFFHE